MFRSFYGNMAEFWTFIAIIVITVITATAFYRISGKYIVRSSTILRNNPTHYKFLRHFIAGAIYFIGFSWAVYRFEPLKGMAQAILASASILAIAVGFAAQSALANIISGLFIIMFKPFRVNDRVKVNDLHGIIEDITLRHTVIRDFENKRIIIPNSIISDEVVVNSDISDERICKWVEMDISYDADIDLAKSIMRDEIITHPAHIDGRTPEQIEEGRDEVPVRIIAMGDSYVRIRGYAWCSDPLTAFIMWSELLESIKKRFDSEGVEIPFPHRTIVYKTDILNQQKPT